MLQPSTNHANANHKSKQHSSPRVKHPNQGSSVFPDKTATNKYKTHLIIAIKTTLTETHKRQIIIRTIMSIMTETHMYKQHIIITTIVTIITETHIHNTL